MGEAKISLDYTGKISEELNGYYYSTDCAEPGKFCAVTQFEPTDARKAFPCWDEPEIKAKFDITLIADSDLTAISNMNEISCEPMAGNDKRKVTDQ